MLREAGDFDFEDPRADHATSPGPTNTDFFHRAGMDQTKVGSEGKYTNDPAEVARQGYQALMDGKDHIFSESIKTKVQGAVSKIIPESVGAETHRKGRSRKRRRHS